MMDQNRCLLDVINNPQLLQSFLESETSATEATGNDYRNSGDNSMQSGAADHPAPATNTFIPDTSITVNTAQVHSSLTATNAIDQLQPATEITNLSQQTECRTQNDNDDEEKLNGSSDQQDNDPNLDPVVSVLNSIITETVAETSPSTRDDIRHGGSPALQGDSYISELSTAKNESSYPPINNPFSYTMPFDDTGMENTTQPNQYGFEQSSSVAHDLPEQQQGVINQGTDIDNNLSANDANNNSTSSSDNGSAELLVDEYYSRVAQKPDDAVHRQQCEQRPDNDLTQSVQGATHSEQGQFYTQNHSTEQSYIESTISTDQSISTSTTNTAISAKSELAVPSDPVSNNGSQQIVSCLSNNEISVPQESDTKQREDTTVSKQDKIEPPTQVTDNQSESKTATLKMSSNISPPVKPAAAQKPTETAPKPKRNTSRAKKIKTQTTASSVTPSAQTPNTSIQTRPMGPTQYISTSSHQQILFQNNAVRQPMMGGQTITGVPQPQRVIQIQTPNGPMYFAIAPGPPANLNNGTSNNSSSNNNNNNMMGQNQQQQPAMQSQYPSQQICFQPTMAGRPQLSTQMMQTQQQVKTQHHSPQAQQMSPERPIGIRQTMMSAPGPTMMVGGHPMIQSQQQARMSSPMVAGQTVAITNQQNSQQQQQSQQQHIVLPSSQHMMMPRAPNQILVNRPMTNTAPLVPGQQQFIQIMTNNGPMLLALPTQPAQPVNNSMIDYNSQLHSAGQQPVRHQVQLQTQQAQIQKPMEINDGASSTKQPVAKNANNSKSGLDLADLLLDCGILPEDKSASQTSGSVKSSQSPSLSQISSPMPQTNSPLPPNDPHTFPNHSQPIPNYTTQPTIQQQPVRITIGPDGQMMMQPAVYGAVRPILAGSVAQAQHMTGMAPKNVIASSAGMMTMTATSHMTPKTTSETSQNDSSKKSAAKSKTPAVKRSRSKKSDVDKFPQLKTPKIVQQQQQQQLQQPQQQQHQQQQPLQTVAVVPMAVLANNPDQKPNLTQLASGQQVPLAKFVAPVMQTGCPPQSSVVSNVIQTNAQTIVQSQSQVISSGQLNTQTIMNTGDSINNSTLQQQQASQQQQGSGFGTVVTTSTSTSHMSSSGNMPTILLKSDFKTGTVESNPHISSSLTPNISLTVDTLKIEQDGSKTHSGPIQTSQSVRGLVQNIGGVTTIVLKPAAACIQTHHQQQQQHQQNQIELQKAKELQQQQQLARQKEIRAQNILNQLGADQNAALNPQTKQAFLSVEDACKRLLRYHVFDTEAITESKIKRVDEIFDAAVESLMKRKQAIYDRFKFTVLKESMKIVPSSEEVMLKQLYVNDELSCLEKDRELFRDYEAQLENMALRQTKVESKDGSNYYAYGHESPKQKVKEHDQDSASHSRDVDDWLISDKWADSRYPSVPDSEAATAIESILNDDMG